MNLTVETELEEDGRWIAEVPDLPGVVAYGKTRDEAIARADAGFLGRVIGWMMRGLNDRYLAQEMGGLKRRSEERARDT
jgi:hypothetical protein